MDARDLRQLRTELVKLAVEKMGAKSDAAAVNKAKALEAYILGPGAVGERPVGFGTQHPGD